MTTTADLCSLSLDELAGRIRAKELSPVESTEACLERIEQLNPKLNAFITVMADQARADARAAADEIAGGTYRGALHGIAIGVKDLCATKGVRTTAGTKVLADWVPDEDSALIERLRAAGAVIVGKTHLHEAAFGTTGVNPHYGPARNPWDPERITGASSSGSGIAAATGMCYAAIGSDTGGSIRIPASLCGVTGLKPTYGRVSLRGTVPLSWSLDHLGPMARTAKDCAHVLSAIAGYDPRDEHCANEHVDNYAGALDQGIEGLRVGVVASALEEAQPEVAAKVREAIDVLRALGCTVSDIDGSLQDYWAIASTVLLPEAAAYHMENFEQRPADFGDDVLLRIQWGMDIKAPDYVQGLRAMSEMRRTCDEVLLSGLDVLVLPSTITPAVTIDSVTKDDPTLGLTRMTAPFNATGQPALSVPCGFTSDNLPVGMQIVGRWWGEAMVLRVAHAFEQERGSWPQPPIP